jgi:hypothetical protein
MGRDSRRIRQDAECSERYWISISATRSFLAFTLRRSPTSSPSALPPPIYTVEAER